MAAGIRSLFRTPTLASTAAAALLSVATSLSAQPGSASQPAQQPARSAVAPQPPAPAAVRPPAPFQPASGARWTCPRTVYDFGEVWQGAPVTFKFEIRNTSNEELQIIDAKPDCHCTVAGNFQRIIPPGGTGYVPFTFLTAGMGNFMTKGALITLNDSRVPNLRVMLQGTVKTVLSSNPIGVGSFGEVTDPQAVIVRECDITANVPEPIKIEMLPIKGQQPFSMSLTEKEKGKSWHMTIKTVPPLPVGYLQYAFQFKTDHPRLPTWTVPANAYRPPRIAARPPAIRMPDDPKNSKPVGVDIMNYGKEPFKITKAEVPAQPTLKVDVTPKGNGYRIDVAAPPGSEIPNGSKLVVNTDDKEIPVIEINLYRVVERPNLPPIAARKPPASRPGGRGRRAAATQASGIRSALTPSPAATQPSNAPAR